MHIVEFMLVVASAYAAFWALYTVTLPAIAGLGRSRNNKANTTPVEGQPSIAVIVPAHNMENVIVRCIESLKACRYPHDKVEIYVVADHCSDNTDGRARAAEASVLTRDIEPRGKTYTLAWAIEAIAARGTDPDMYVIVDATVRVNRDFLEALATRALQGEEIIIGHAAVDPENQQWFAQCLGLSLAHRNLQNSAREELGFSALIEGRGMAYTRSFIKRYGWTLALPDTTRTGSHPTEDWRHGVRAVEQGYRVSYSSEARVFTPLRDSLSAATQQGIRWERGRVANAATHGLRLLLLGLRQRNPLKVLAALDAIQPPVAILGGLSIGIAAFAWVASGARFSLILGVAPLILVSLYAFVVFAHGRRDGIRPTAILWAPAYVAWRCMSFVLALGFRDRIKSSGQDQMHQ